MTTDEQDQLTREEVMRRARELAEEIFRDLQPRLPDEVQDDVSKGLADVLRMVEDSLTVLAKPIPAGHEEFISTAEAARLLFVSRPHVVKLIDEGTLPLHHRTGQNRFVLKADALAYKERKLTEAKTWVASQTEDTEPPGL